MEKFLLSKILTTLYHEVMSPYEVPKLTKIDTKIVKSLTA